MPGLKQQLNKNTTFFKKDFPEFRVRDLLAVPFVSNKNDTFLVLVFFFDEANQAFLMTFSISRMRLFILFRSKVCFSLAKWQEIARPHSLLLTFSPLSGNLFSLIPSL